jgi:hypothetical protein
MAGIVAGNDKSDNFQNVTLQDLQKLNIGDGFVVYIPKLEDTAIAATALCRKIPKAKVAMQRGVDKFGAVAYKVIVTPKDKAEKAEKSAV